MKIIIVLLIISFNSIRLYDPDGNYSNEQEFLEELVQNEIYKFFQEIKYYWDDSVAIEACIEMYHTIRCETVIRVYITDVSLRSLRMKIDKDTNITYYTEEEKSDNFVKLRSIFYSYTFPPDIQSRLDIIINKVAKKFDNIFAPEPNTIVYSDHYPKYNNRSRL